MTPQNFGDIYRTHRRTRVTGFCFVDWVNREKANSVGALSGASLNALHSTALWRNFYCGSFNPTNAFWRMEFQVLIGLLKFAASCPSNAKSSA
jgi:hypothetical protein